MEPNQSLVKQSDKKKKRSKQLCLINAFVSVLKREEPETSENIQLVFTMVFFFPGGSVMLFIQKVCKSGAFSAPSLHERL